MNVLLALGEAALPKGKSNPGEPGLESPGIFCIHSVLYAMFAELFVHKLSILPLLEFVALSTEFDENSTYFESSCLSKG